VTSQAGNNLELMPGGDVMRGHCSWLWPAHFAYGTRPRRSKPENIMQWTMQGLRLGYRQKKNRVHRRYVNFGPTL